jgi:hypothetical protein
MIFLGDKQDPVDVRTAEAAKNFARRWCWRRFRPQRTF